MTFLSPPSSLDDSREFATDVVRRLRAAGFQALWAGGCVRDLTLGHAPSDYDVATDARPEQVMDLFRKRTVPVGEQFGVVRVRGPHGSGLEVEVATFRSDGAYIDGRRPESVVFSSPELDAQRRDFTINGMFFDPFRGEVIDYVDGLKDFRDGVVCAIGDPPRGSRKTNCDCCARCGSRPGSGFASTPRHCAAVVAMAEQLPVVAPERIAGIAADARP